MKKWQIENSETSEISEILFRVFLFPSFRFCPIAKIENSDLKISEKNFRVFRVFDLASKIISLKKSIIQNKKLRMVTFLKKIKKANPVILMEKSPQICESMRT